MGRRAAPLWLALAVAISLIVLARYIPHSPDPLLMDFKSFYCGSKTALTGADPYRTEPLRTCERARSRLGLFAARGNIVVPAPLPGYVFAALAPLAFLPFDVAAVLWELLLAGALVGGLATLRRLSRDSWTTLAAAFALGTALVSLSLGQMAPLIIGLLIAAGAALEKKRPQLAAVAALGTLLEPHVGLAACLSLFIWVRSTRLALLVGAGGLALLAVAVTGPVRTAEYLIAVVPAAASANAFDHAQYSLTALLTTLGVSQTASIQVGELSYLAMLTLAIFVSRALARDLQTPALLVLVPPAMVLLGGAYIHISQVAIALPAVLLLRQRGRPDSPALTLAIVALAIPWYQTVAVPELAVLGAACAFLLTKRVFGKRGALLTAFVAALYPLALTALTQHASALQPGLMAALANPAALAETSWGLLLRGTPHAPAWWTSLVRLPTWLGLIAFVVSACARALRGERAARRGAARAIQRPASG